MATLSRRGPRTVPYIITKNSVIDGFGHGYGRGKWLLDEKTAEYADSKEWGRRATPDDYTKEELKELEDKLAGKSAKVGRPDDAPPSDLDRNKKTASEDDGPKRVPVEKALPDDFPGREELVAAGYDTLSKVRKASEEDLAAIKGIGKATLTKIGLEIGG
jgi:hypothetical protein